MTIMAQGHGNVRSVSGRERCVSGVCLDVSGVRLGVSGVCLGVSGVCLGVTVKLTAANLIRVVRAVRVVVTLLVFPDALAVGTGELVWRTTNFKRKTSSAVSDPLTGLTSLHQRHKPFISHHQHNKQKAEE